VRRARALHLERLAPVGRERHVVALLLEKQPHGESHIRVVVDNEDALAAVRSGLVHVVIA
jgi:hypothetical protein